MAVEAQGRFRLGEQIVHIGSVGEVTCFAAIGLQDFMRYFLLVVLLLVALGADSRAFLLKQMGYRGRMGIMTIRAFPCPHSRVHFSLVQSHFFYGMARVAKIILGFLQEQLGNLAVPEMAVLAFFLFHHLVHIFHAEILVGKFFMAIQTLLLFKFPLGNRLGGRCKKNRPAQQKEHCK